MKTWRHIYARDIYIYASVYARYTQETYTQETYTQETYAQETYAQETYIRKRHIRKRHMRKRHIRKRHILIRKRHIRKRHIHIRKTYTSESRDIHDVTSHKYTSCNTLQHTATRVNSFSPSQRNFFVVLDEGDCAFSMLQCVAVCCSVLQCVAVCLQLPARNCSSWRRRPWIRLYVNTCRHICTNMWKTCRRLTRRIHVNKNWKTNIDTHKYTQTHTHTHVHAHAHTHTHTHAHTHTHTHPKQVRPDERQQAAAQKHRSPMQLCTEHTFPKSS